MGRKGSEKALSLEKVSITSSLSGVSSRSTVQVLFSYVLEEHRVGMGELWVWDGFW